MSPVWPKKVKRFINGELIDVLEDKTGLVVDGDGNEYRRDEKTKRFVPANQKETPIPTVERPRLKEVGLKVGAEPKFGQLVFFPNGDVGRWQPNPETGEMELYLQKAKKITTLSPTVRSGGYGSKGRIR